MIDSIRKAKQLRQVAQEPGESELVQALTHIIATIEHRQLEAVEDLHDELDVDALEVHGDQEDREDQLLELVGAVADGRFQEWWFEEIGDGNLKNPDQARSYAGLDDEAWEKQIEAWGEVWREQVGDEMANYSDRDFAEVHVERKFGCSIEEFEREVVGWDRQTAMRKILAGNFEAVEDGIRTAEAAVRDQGGEDGD